MIKINKEIWKDIAGFEGIYQVSNFGNVRSGYILNGRNIFLEKDKSKWRIMNSKASGGRTKYKRVKLCLNGAIYRKTIHRLVAETFIPNPNNYPCVNHKDENKENNRADNLEWCTYKYNSNYGTARKRTLEKITAYYSKLKTAQRELQK